MVGSGGRGRHEWKATRVELLLMPPTGDGSASSGRTLPASPSTGGLIEGRWRETRVRHWSASASSRSKWTFDFVASRVKSPLFHLQRQASCSAGKLGRTRVFGEGGRMVSHRTAHVSLEERQGRFVIRDHRPSIALDQGPMLSPLNPSHTVLMKPSETRDSSSGKHRECGEDRTVGDYRKFGWRPAYRSSAGEGRQEASTVEAGGDGAVL
nr:hypothetical protein CFP56_11890 [Quercus suber]